MHPDDLAGGAVQADHVAAGAGHGIEPALDQQRRALQVELRARAEMPGLEFPGHFQLVEIGGVDLVQRLVAVIGEVAAIAGPVGVGRRRRLRRHWQGGRHRRAGRGRQHQSSGKRPHDIPAIFLFDSGATLARDGRKPNVFTQALQNGVGCALRQGSGVEADQDGQTQQGDVDRLEHTNLTRLQCYRSLK